MTDEVKKCVDIRINFFDEYFTIPEDMQNEVQAFIADITLLGNSCNSATEFEQKFVSEGLSERQRSKRNNQEKSPKKYWQKTKMSL